MLERVIEYHILSYRHKKFKVKEWCSIQVIGKNFGLKGSLAKGVH
jgi:hypothetical protein